MGMNKIKKEIETKTKGIKTAKNKVLKVAIKQKAKIKSKYRA